MSTPATALQQAIDALEAQRAVLGDAVIDLAQAPLRAQLAMLAAPPAAAAPERRLRQASILFLDIVGSTRLSQHLDPEDIQQVMDGALVAFTEIVRRHQGEVLQYAGDNLLATFGADATREDDAERAVSCGLALLQEAARHRDLVRRLHGRDGFDARVGVHTGSVLRGGGVDDDSTLRGLAVNIAARMEQTAPPGRLRVSQDTWALVRGRFDAEAQPPIEVKGHDAPIASWLVRGPRQRAGRGIDGVETPLVGRDAELRQLQACADEVARTGRPRAVTLLAEAGLGKSRLLDELQRRIGRGGPWRLLGSRAQPSSALQPHGLLRELVVRQFDIQDGDPAETARGKLLQGLAPWLAEAGDPAAELVGQLIGLDFSASAPVRRLGGDARLLRDKALRALGLWLQRLAGADGASLLIELDDLHWSDDASLEALTVLGQACGARPMLLLMGARPALLERRPAWGDDLPSHERLVLQPLDAAQRAQITRDLLDRLSPVPRELAELVEQRAEGNPYYAEELVQMLLDQGVIATDGDRWRFAPERLDASRIPGTLTGVLQARLDALAPPERRTLQMASVIGPVFWDAAVARLDDAAPAQLPRLEDKALVHRRPASTFDDTTERGFQHQLLQQASYETVLKSERRRAHALAAQWLEAHAGDRHDEVLAITAQHHERSGQPERAADCWRRAALLAEQRFANALAGEYHDRAEVQWRRTAGGLLPEVEAELLERRIPLWDVLARRDRQQRDVDRLLELARLHGERTWESRALAQAALIAEREGRIEAARDLAIQGAEAAEAVGNVRTAALCHGNLAWMAIERGERELARHHLERAVHHARIARERMERPNDGIYEVQLCVVASQYHRLANDDHARGEVIARGLELVRQMNHPRLCASCLEAAALWAIYRLDVDLAERHLAEFQRLADEVGIPWHGATVAGLGATLRLIIGDAAAAERLAAETAERYHALGFHGRGLHFEVTRAEALWGLGRRDEAAGLWRQCEPAHRAEGGTTAALACRLRLAEHRAVGGDLAAAAEAVRAERPALDEPDALRGAEFPQEARLAAWRVLFAAGDPAASRQLELARADADALLASFAEVDVRERVRTGTPWVRAVERAEAQPQREIESLVSTFRAGV